MTTHQENHKIEETMKTMSSLVKGLGIVVMAFGSFCLLTVESIQNLTGYGAGTITIVSWAFMVVGLGIVAVPFIEKFKARKLQ